MAGRRGKGRMRGEGKSVAVVVCIVGVWRRVVNGGKWRAEMGEMEFC